MGSSITLYGLWALPVVALLLLLGLRRRRALVARLGPLVGRDVGQRANRRHRTRLIAMWVGLGLVVVSLAQPRWGYRWQELKREGLSIVVVLDTSSSMAAEDVSPSRMDRAKREILDLTELLAGDRLGLVLFAGGAYPRMPLTLDYNAIRRVVKQADTTTLRSQGSDLGAALEAAGKLLGASGAADRAIIVVSDGEDQLGKAPAVAEALADKGVHLYAIGVGTDDGAPIPEVGGGFKKDASGAVVLSRLEESVLHQIASIGQGAYVRSVAGNGDMRAIYGDEIRGKLQTSEQAARRSRIWDERFQWPLGVGLFVLVIGFLARGPRRREAVVSASLAMLVLALPARAAEEGQSIAELTEQQVSSPDDLGVAERLGAALFADGQYNRAEEVLSSVADRTTDAEARNRARYNAGLAAYRGGRLTEAVEDWQRLLQEGEHPAAAKNAQAVQQEIAKRTNQEPPDQQDGDGESGDGQDPPEQPEDSNQDQDQGDDPKQDGEDSPENNGERDPSEESDPEEPPPGEGGEISDGQPPEAGDSGAPQTPPPEVGSISQQEAERMFDGVEEGSPRVVVDPGSSGGNDW